MGSKLNDTIVHPESIAAVHRSLAPLRTISSNQKFGRPCFVNRLDGWAMLDCIRASMFRSFTRIGMESIRFHPYSSIPSLWEWAFHFSYLHFWELIYSSDLCRPYSWTYCWKAFHERWITSPADRGDCSNSWHPQYHAWCYCYVRYPGMLLRQVVLTFLHSEHSSSGSLGAFEWRYVGSTTGIRYFNDFEEYLTILETGLRQKKKSVTNIIKQWDEKIFPNSDSSLVTGKKIDKSSGLKKAMDLLAADSEEEATQESGRVSA